METKKKTIVRYLMLSPKDKLALLRKSFGAWKGRNSIKELNKIRKSLDRFK